MFTGSGSKYAELADKHGFIVVYPSAASSSMCWDVSSAKGLKRNGGSDSQGLLKLEMTNKL
jgi:poly(3-hydroxybutyrate) depolymerase